MRKTLPRTHTRPPALLSDTKSGIVSDMSRQPAAARRRPKIAATVDPSLLQAVDAWLRLHPDFDRSKVIDEALRLWCARVQERAMEEQFSSPDEVDRSEWDAWRAIRDAAAARQLAPTSDD
jgi:hypothetical protein